MLGTTAAQSYTKQPYKMRLQKTVEVSRELTEGLSAAGSSKTSADTEVK